MASPSSAQWNSIPHHPIQALAQKRVHSKPYLALKNVSCDFQDGVLVLRGWLPSYYLKQIAQEAVAGMDTVHRIENRIEVKKSGP